MTEVEVIPTLSDEERARLVELERTIERDLETFVEVGLALKTVRDEGLYRDVQPPTFVAYLRQRWGMGESTGYQLIDAARVARATSAIAEVSIPSESVARVLVPFLNRETDDQPQLAEMWSTVIKQIGDEPITAGRVRRALTDAGYVVDDRSRSTSGKANQAILLGQYGDRLGKALQRLERFLDREFTPPTGKHTGELAIRYAAWCSVMAAVLEALASGDPVADELRDRLHHIAGEVLG